MPTTPVALFDVDLALLQTLEGSFGPPIDSYLMGWQVWLVEVGDDDVELEYRLHPPAGFEQPSGLSHHDLWDEVMAQVAEGIHPFELGEEARPLGSLWELLEVFPAFGEDVPVVEVQRWAEAALGRPAVGAGEVDHERLGGRWKRKGHALDLPGALRDAVSAREP